MNIKLDYDIESIEERLELVNKILAQNPEPNEYYLERMADYLIVPLDKAEKLEQKKLITSENRKETFRRNEVSYEGLAASLESGEDGIYNLMGDVKRFTKKNLRKPITKQDIEDIPELAQLREDIEFWLRQGSRAVGKKAYQIQGFIKEMRKFQYEIRDSFKPPIIFKNITPTKYVCEIFDDFWIEKDGTVRYEGISFCNPRVCSAVLCNYSRLKQEGWDDLKGDLYTFMMDFDKYCGLALDEEPILKQIVIDKIDGMQNSEIQSHLDKTFGMSYSTEYISSLYRNKIPKLIASAAEDAYIQDWFLNHEKGNYKRCSRCGQTKLAHAKYFSKNSTSNDGFYSICKDCRNSSEGGKNN